MQELSSMLYEYSNLLKTNLETLGTLDLIFAKASYSLQLDGIYPKINKEKHINLIKVRHPLISRIMLFLLMYLLEKITIH